jgi:hypothetical protein
MHDNDNFGPSLTGYKAQEVRTNLLKVTAITFFACTLVWGSASDIAVELLELALLTIFGSQRFFNLTCRIIKRGK